MRIMHASFGPTSWLQPSSNVDTTTRKAERFPLQIQMGLNFFMDERNLG
jgi:hypothetical protein